ncbi:MAG TPA: TonB family protein [Candidatus Dormibacteraeota bacterium]|nr:TonB family protein [Candidatus Dormibacteraeota bacterium]
MLELSPRRTVTPPVPTAKGNQQSRLLVALVLLLGALAAVLIKDRQFWFGSEQTIIDAGEVAQPAAASQTASRAPAVPATSPAVHAAKKQVAAAKTLAPSKPVETPAITTNRTLLPPLDVEVVAGDTHHKLRPGSNATKLEIARAGSAPAKQAAPATNAAERERIADAAPVYPQLAQHMNVQGSVILQALIGADGTIQNLRVMSGPAILTTAAQQAVREWRFKPVLQNGQAVETRATITVNFTIKVADSSAQTTLAETRASDTLIITR